jgi:hypothetical protein
MIGLQQNFKAELQLADDAHKDMQAALGRQQVLVIPLFACVYIDKCIVLFECDECAGNGASFATAARGN